MAVLMHNEVTEGNLDLYDQIAAKARVEEDPADGLIIHTVTERDGGGFLVVDVWESEDHFHRFREERLMPAFSEVVGEEAGGPPQQQFKEIHHLVHP